MRIALLSYEYPAETGFGGIGTYTWYHARALVKLGHEVHVISGSVSRTGLRSERHDGVTVWRLNNGIAPYGYKMLKTARCFWSAYRTQNALNMSKGLRALQQQGEFDLVEMPECGAEGLLVTLRHIAPTVVKLHSPSRLIMDFYPVTTLDRKICSALEDVAIHRARAIVSCSQFLADEMRPALGDQRPIRVIPNGIDIELFDASSQIDVRQKFDLPRERPIIFFAGRMEQRKGVHLFEEIASRILTRYPVAFVFAGDDLFGIMKNQILPALEAQDLRGSVHFLGRLDLGEVRSCLRQTDVFLIPSLWENCPYSCLEAMAASRAIVSSDAGGLPEVIHHEQNGLVAQSGNAASFADAIARFVEDPELRNRLGTAARASIESSHRDTDIASRTVELYRTIAHESVQGQTS